MRQPLSRRDLEYDEAMRKLDDRGESEVEEDGQETSRSSFSLNSTQPSVVAGPPARSRPSEKKAKKSSTLAKTKGGAPSSFEIPEGNKTITVDSSPISENFVENYAEDSIDKTYEEPCSLPRRSSPARKRSSEKGKVTRNRGKSAPLARAADALTAAARTSAGSRARKARKASA